MLKVIALLLVVGGIWVWVSGKSVTDEVVDAQTVTASLPAAVILTPGAESGYFDQEGTIVLDMTESTEGTPYILYTHYNEQGRPSVRTKRLVFGYQNECVSPYLPCRADAPQIPVKADDVVRVIGEVKNERVEVQQLQML